LYFVGPVPGYSVGPSSGIVTVAGANQSEAVDFHQVTYAVTFAETGLANGASWSVTFGEVLQTSDSSSIVVTEPNGSYPYSVTQVAGYTVMPDSGNVTLDGAAQAVFLDFTLRSIPSYTVTFTEIGLPSDSSWSVTLNGAQTYARAASIGFPETNGTYAFEVGVVTGYTATPSSGAVTVDGRIVTRTITFAAIPVPSSSASPTFLGLPLAEGYALLAGIIAALVVGAAVAVLLMRRRQAPPTRAKPIGQRDPSESPSSR
jgi:hypothetical protein